jgi:hypothetical protein
VFLVFLFTLLMFVGVLFVLLWVRTPHYMPHKAEVSQLLQKILVGQASENDWAIFLGTSFRHRLDLEEIRLACLAIDEREYLGHSRSGYLFTETGMEAIRNLLVELEKLDD